MNTYGQEESEKNTPPAAGTTGGAFRGRNRARASQSLCCDVRDLRPANTERSWKEPFSQRDYPCYVGESSGKHGALLQLPIDIADGALDRIDRVIVEWKTTNYVDLPEIKVLKGTASSTPEAPALTNNSTVRQISLARVAVGAGITAVTASMITDERLDPAVCGLVTDGLSIDTTTINAQYTAMLDSLAQELAQLEAGTGVELAKLCFANTAVPAAAWASDSTYGDYPYRAAVALSGVTAAMVPEVVFGLAAMADTSFAPVAECYNGGVYIYAADAPGATITIPTIICWRGGASA